MGCVVSDARTSHTKAAVKKKKKKPPHTTSHPTTACEPGPSSARQYSTEASHVTDAAAPPAAATPTAKIGKQKSGDDSPQHRKPSTHDVAASPQHHERTHRISSVASRAGSVAVDNLHTSARENNGREKLWLVDGDTNLTGDGHDVNIMRAATATRKDSAFADRAPWEHPRRGATRKKARTPFLNRTVHYTATPAATSVGSLSQPLLRPCAATIIPRLSFADMHTLVGPLEEYEQRFGHLYYTAKTPFVSDWMPVRGTVGLPTPQPDLSEAPQRRAREHTPVRLVGAVYVARRVLSPDWAALELRREVDLSQQTSAASSDEERERTSSQEEEEKNYADVSGWREFLSLFRS